jgi:hypothetical protein
MMTTILVTMLSQEAGGGQPWMPRRAAATKTPDPFAPFFSVEHELIHGSSPQAQFDDS